MAQITIDFKGSNAKTYDVSSIEIINIANVTKLFHRNSYNVHVLLSEFNLSDINNIRSDEDSVVSLEDRYNDYYDKDYNSPVGFIFTAENNKLAVGDDVLKGEFVVWLELE